MAYRETANLLAALPGHDAALAKGVVVVGAHIDHLGTQPFTGVVFPGADDNASGVAVVMEVARLLAAQAEQTARTVLFAIWNAEEMGLLGSMYYVWERPSYPLQDTITALSVDRVGKGGGKALCLRGGADLPLAWLADLFDEVVATEGLSCIVNRLPATPRSDHFHFRRHGVPALLVETCDEHATWHTPADTADGVSPGALEMSAQVLRGLVASLARGK